MMEPEDVEAIPTYTKVYRLHPIEEDDAENTEPVVEPATQSPSEDKSQEHL